MDKKDLTNLKALTKTMFKWGCLLTLLAPLLFWLAFCTVAVAVTTR